MVSLIKLKTIRIGDHASINSHSVKSPIRSLASEVLTKSWISWFQISYLEIEEEVQSKLHRQTCLKSPTNDILSWSVSLAFEIPQYSESAQISYIIITCICLFLREHCSPGKPDALRLNNMTSFIIYAYGITRKLSPKQSRILLVSI
jgi:hypothetical protein